MIPPRIKNLFDKAVITFYPQENRIRFENRTRREKGDLVYVVLTLTTRTWEVYYAWDWGNWEVYYAWDWGNKKGHNDWPDQKKWAEEYFSEKYDLSKFKLIRS